MPRGTYTGHKQRHDMTCLCRHVILKPSDHKFAALQNMALHGLAGSFRIALFECTQDFLVVVNVPLHAMGVHAAR